MTDQNEKLREAVIERLRDVERLIARGKGEWPQDGYVRDSTWDDWIGQRAALRWVLRRAGSNPDEVTL